MSGLDIIVVGASAGGIEALVQLVRGLPAGLPASVFVVCHFPSGFPSRLPEILSREGPLLARHARDGEATDPGHIYVAPPDLHLALEPGLVRLSRGPRENRFRPSIDVLFRSAARAYGPRVGAVMLSGSLIDGVAGLLAVRGAGGVAVVQDPADALLPDLPRSALKMTGADHVIPAREIGPLLARLAVGPRPGAVPMNDPIERITQTAERDLAQQGKNGRPGQISAFTCPECGGALWQMDEQKLVGFRCHVGHAYAAEVLLEEKSAALEAALWTAVRMFREKAVLARQMAGRARAAGTNDAAERFEDEARLADQHGEMIRGCLGQGEAAPPVKG
jgi:two-component system chemotaxis response regulator CheB